MPSVVVALTCRIALTGCIILTGCRGDASPSARHDTMPPPSTAPAAAAAPVAPPPTTAPTAAPPPATAPPARRGEPPELTLTARIRGSRRAAPKTAGPFA